MVLEQNSVCLQTSALSASFFLRKGGRKTLDVPLHDRDLHQYRQCPEVEACVRGICLPMAICMFPRLDSGQARESRHFTSDMSTICNQIAYSACFYRSCTCPARVKLHVNAQILTWHCWVLRHSKTFYHAYPAVRRTP